MGKDPQILQPRLEKIRRCLRVQTPILTMVFGIYTGCRVSCFIHYRGFGGVSASWILPGVQKKTSKKRRSINPKATRKSFLTPNQHTPPGFSQPNPNPMPIFCCLPMGWSTKDEKELLDKCVQIQELREVWRNSGNPLALLKRWKSKRFFLEVDEVKNCFGKIRWIDGFGFSKTCSLALNMSAS